MKKIGVKTMVRIGVVAALYVALCAVLAPVSFGPMQFRAAEAMALLPVLWLEAIPGVCVGCFFANLFFGFGIIDAVVGSAATLIAAAITYRCRKKIWVAAIPPVVVNAVIIGLMLYFMESAPLLLTMATVALGQAGACFALGVPLVLALGRVRDKL